MKTIENISNVFEMILLKGFEGANAKTEILLFQASIKLFFIEDTIFTLYKKLNTHTNKEVVNLYEVKRNESSYLFTVFSKIVEDLDMFGPKEADKEKAKIYSIVIDFCKKVSFNCADFETTVEDL